MTFLQLKPHVKAPKSATAAPIPSAFTLNELMVVLGTIAILAVLVFPVLARSTDNGTRLVCLNNLRQLGLALNMYAAENRDYLAYPNWDGGNSAAPTGWLYSASSGSIPDPINAAPWKSNPVSAWQTGGWFQYVQNQKYYLCPVDIENADYARPATSGGRVVKLSSYVMNGAVTGYPEGGYGTPCKITDVWNPACYLLWEPDENAAGPGNPGALVYNDGAESPGGSEGVGRLHSLNGGNVLGVGGNVQLVTVQTWKVQATLGSGPGPGGRTLAWWSTASNN